MKKKSSLKRKVPGSRINKNKIFLVGLAGLLFILACFAIAFSVSNNETPDNQTIVNTPNYKISIINNNAGGNITKNKVLMDNIPKTTLNDEIIATALNGTVMVTFGDGSEPRVMIVSGTHGGELPSQIAALNLINYLSNKKINGTIYIVPFAIPSNTADNVRFSNDTDPNRVANIPGTPTNVITETAKNNNITLFGDFHSSRPDDVPGKNCLIYYPNNPKSVELSKYLKNKTNSPLTKVGPYPGVVATVTNNNGITSITCEVLSPHGEIKPGSLELSYQYMISFLEYAHSIIQ